MVFHKWHPSKMYARPLFLEPLYVQPLHTLPLPEKIFHVPLLVPEPSNVCDNCYSCQLWKQLMAICDAHDFRTELPIGLVD